MNNTLLSGELHVPKLEKKPQLHTSALEMKCMEQVRRRYVEKEIIPPGVFAIVGTGVDRGVTKNLDNKIRTSELLSLEEVADITRDGVNQAWEQGVRLDPEEVAAGIKAVKGQAVDKAVRLGQLHAKAKAPTIEPTHVQRKWTLELNGYPFDLVGTLDIQEGKTSVRDTKTSGKTPAADIAHRSVQLKTYALAISIIDGHTPQKTVLDYLIDTSRPDTKSFEHQPTDDDSKAVLARVEVFARAMESGVFVPVEPSHWVCDPKWCGYATTCRYYTARPKQFAA